MKSKSRMPKNSGEIKPEAYQGRWFRMYSTVLQDRRWQTLNGETFKFWVNVMALAAETQGHIPDYDTIAFRLRIDASAVAEAMDAVREAGLLEACGEHGEPVLRPRNWAQHQYVEKASTLRMRELRKRRKVDQSDAGSLVHGVDFVTVGDVTCASRVTNVRTSTSSFLPISRKYPSKIGKREGIVSAEGKERREGTFETAGVTGNVIVLTRGGAA